MCPDITVLPKKHSQSPFHWEEVKDNMVMGSFLLTAAVTRLSLGTVSGLRMSTVTMATATKAFPGAVADGLEVSM